LITTVVMPQMGLEVTEGTVAAIHVEVGASVAHEDLLLELETDKALTDVVAPRDGVVAGIEVELGDTVPVGATLLLLADSAEERPSEGRARVLAGVGAGSARTEYGRLRSAPVARRAAARLGLELATISGTGPRGRITLADVERAADSRNNSSGLHDGHLGQSEAPTTEVEPMSSTRRAIARRMTRSQAIPQFSLERELDATLLLADKAALGEPGPGEAKPTINDMLVQALGEIVLRHPELATSYVEGDAGEPMIARRSGADVGLAVATDRGLLVPVIRGAYERSLSELAADRVRLIGAARSGRLTFEEMTGASVTLSNLGGFGIDRFVAMLNPGEAAILAVGRIVERAVPRGRGIQVVPTLTLTLTVDHRVIDGAGGAGVLVEFAELLEGAMTWRI
jgi:pyruvate dehydrogenase E2 component (dihydrolipoamide acetyltransferase)